MHDGRDDLAEQAVRFPSDGQTLFGILTDPDGEAGSAGVVVMQGGGYIPATHRNRLWVRLCRALAGRGFHALRFDYHGVGESTGEVEHYALDRPFVSDARAAIECLRGRGVGRVTLVGNCFGARTALATAAAVPGVDGALLLSCPVGDFTGNEKAIAGVARRWTLRRYVAAGMKPRNLLGLFTRRRNLYARLLVAKWRAVRARRRGLARSALQSDARPGDRFLADLDEVTRLGIPTLLVYGEADLEYVEFRRCRASIEPLIHAVGSRVGVVALPGRLAGFPSLEIQDAVIELITTRLGQSAPAASKE